MTEQIIKTILVLSAAGGCLALLFLVLKPVFSRLFGNAFRFYMWLLVFVLLLAPARIDFKSIPPKQPMAGGVEITANIDGEKNAPAQENAVTARENKPETAEKAAESRGARLPRLNGWDILFFAWLLGICLFLLLGGISYVRFLRKIYKESEPISCPTAENVRQKLHIRRAFSVRRANFKTPPLMIGLFRPILLLPDRHFSESEQSSILLHELTHFKRFDLWYKWLAFLANAVHWFNPLVYLAVRQMQISCEFSCDEAATRSMNDQEKKEYMRTILKLTEQREDEKHV